MKSLDRAKLLFVLSLCLASFGIGAATMEFETFPCSLLHEARASAAALWHSYRPTKYDRDHAPDSAEVLEAPAVRHHSGTAESELILVSGGRDYMKNLSPDRGALAWVIDREGAVKHVWHLPEDLWDDLKQVTSLPGSQFFCFGLHVFPNGDLLASFQGVDAWPYGIGIARFDKDSNLIWKKELLNHHWFTIGDDGRIYSPAQRAADAPLQLPGRTAKMHGKDGKMLADVILVLDAQDGSVLDEISMIDAFVEADRVGLLTNAQGWDPLHLNAAHVVTQALAAEHPLLKTGDILVSFRNINTIGVIDGATKRFKWIASGVTVKQHSPQVFDGGILSFDNHGGDDKSGGSRLSWIDLTTRESKTLFPRPGVPLPGSFRSRVAGRVEVHRDKQRALVTLSCSGAIWEVDLTTGEVPWEYVYTHPHDPGPRRTLYTAQYLYDLDFLMSCGARGP